jgi:hypothetical protein
VALGFVDGDSTVDAVFANSAQRNRVCLGDGAGGFACSDVSADTNQSLNVALGFVDGDSTLDAVFANFNQRNRVCLGDGAGGFACSDVSADTNDSVGMALGFVDGDTTLDAVFANQFQRNRVCLGDGAGGFACSDVSADANDSRGVALANPANPPPPTTANSLPPSSKKCFIATAAFGSPLAPEVQLLREVRDQYLLPHPPGQAFVALYYTLSPPVADVIAGSEILRTITRGGLVPIIGWASLVLWSPGLGLGVLLGVLGFGSWLALRVVRRRHWMGAAHAVSLTGKGTRSRRAALWRRLATWSCVLFALAVTALLEAGPRELPQAEHSIEVVGEVRLPQAAWFALIRDEETGRMGLYKDGEAIFQGQEPLPLGKVRAVRDEILVLALPNGRTMEIARGARLPGPRQLIFVRSAIVDTLRFQVRFERTATSGDDYYLVELRGRRATLEREWRTTTARGAPRRPNAERLSVPSGSEMTTIAGIVNRTPFTEVAPDTWEIPKEHAKELGNQVRPLFAEALSSVRPGVSLDGGVGLSLSTSLGSGTLDRRGFEIGYAKMAQRTGLEVGDRILSVGGEPVNSIGGLIRIYRGLKGDAAVSEVNVVVERNNERRTLTYRIR